MEQATNNDEITRDSQLISRAEAIKTIKKSFCDENAKLKHRPEVDQRLLGDFLSVVESAMLQDVKSLQVKSVDGHLAELYSLSGCTNVSQLIAKFKSLENQ